MRETKTTIIDFYQSAYGPTIRIDVQDIEWLKLLKVILTRLTSKDISELDLLSLNNVERGEISGFRIVLGLSADLSVISNMQSKIYPSFVWTVNAEYMEYIIGAIDWYLEHNESGHHYLYEDEIDIELAYKE